MGLAVVDFMQASQQPCRLPNCWVGAVTVSTMDHPEVAAPTRERPLLRHG